MREPVTGPCPPHEDPPGLATARAMPMDRMSLQHK